MERREGVELRADGRTLTGAVVTWGEVSPSHRERFTPGSLTPDPDLVLNLGHDRMRALAFGDALELEDRADAFIARARLPHTPAADVALEGVKSGRFQGYSKEFIAEREHRDAAGIRVIEAARLAGLGLVDSPSYTSNQVEVRRRIGSVSSSIPRNQAMDCRCADGCSEASITGTVEISDTAIAIRRGYAEALASRAKNTLRVELTDDAIEVGLDLPDTSYARDLLEAADNVPLIIRPVVDFDASEWARDGTLARFEHLAAAAFVVGFSDMSKGHQEAAINKRRRLLWL